MKQYKTVDSYIADQPADIQAKLKNIRKIVKKSAPKATEKISYGIPYYSLNGRLVYFAAFRNHIGFYPMTSTIKAFKKDLAGYETSKGTVRFPHDKPLPLPLIKQMIDFRIKENLSKK